VISRACRLAEVAQQFQSGQHWVVGARGPELQSCDQRGREFVQCLPAIGSGDQRVFAGQSGERPHVLARMQQLWPSNRLVDRLKGVGVVFLRGHERLDRAVEQEHQSADIRGTGDITPPCGIARFREHAADQLVSHVQHGIRQAAFQIGCCGNEDRPPPVCRVAAELMGVRGISFMHELPLPLRRNALG
jgi:hypothetical protein